MIFCNDPRTKKKTTLDVHSADTGYSTSIVSHGTAELCEKMTEFFDCIKVRNQKEGVKSRNPDVAQYKSADGSSSLVSIGFHENRHFKIAFFEEIYDSPG